MSDILESYDRLVRQGKTPVVIRCHSDAIGAVIKEMNHNHIPIYHILLDDGHPGKIGFSWEEMDGLIAEEHREHYTNFTITLPPSVDYWKGKGMA